MIITKNAKAVVAGLTVALLADIVVKNGKNSKMQSIVGCVIASAVIVEYIETVLAERKLIKDAFINDHKAADLFSEEQRDLQSDDDFFSEEAKAEFERLEERMNSNESKEAFKRLKEHMDSTNVS